MNKKKVLVFNLTPRGGMLHYSSQFCNELSKKVFLKVVVASYYSENLYNENINLIKIHTNPNLRSFIFDTLFFWNHIILLFKILLFSPDVIHFIDNHPWYIFYSKILKLFGFHIYTTQHDPTLHSGENVTLLGKVAVKVNSTLRNLSDKIFVHGESLRRELIENYKINENKIFSIVHGNYNFLCDLFSKGGKPDENTFLFFGRIVDYKGLDVLLNSLDFVKANIPDFKLIIAGSGNLDKYRVLLDKFSKNIEIYNYDIPDNEIYKYFDRVEFVVLPYKDATGSGIIPLAYAFSKAVIVTNVGELSSVVEDDITGAIIDRLSSSELGEKIVDFLLKKDKVKCMGKNGREFTERVLGWERIINIIYEIN